MKGPALIFQLLILGLTLTLGSCKKDPEFVAGEVLFQTYDTVSFYNAYKLFENLQLKIKEAYSFQYLIKTTADSVDTITSILYSKSYLTSASGGITFGILYLSDTLHITANFFDLDSIEANDWFNTIAILNLKENLNGNFFKWGALIVPIGQEQYWVDKLNSYSIIEAAQLNHIIH